MYLINQFIHTCINVCYLTTFNIVWRFHNRNYRFATLEKSVSFGKSSFSKAYEKNNHTVCKRIMIQNVV